MRHVTPMLMLAVLLSSCATHRPCIELPSQKAPDLKKQGFVLTVEQDKKLCEIEQTPEQKEKGECGKPYDVMADREAVLKGDGKRLSDLITSISCR